MGLEGSRHSFCQRHGQSFSEIVFRNRVIAELNGVEVLVRLTL